MTSSAGRSVDEPSPKGQPLRQDVVHRAEEDDAAVHSGGCHCAAIRLRFETGGPLAPRACQCGFCRRHGALTVSDPDGQAELTLRAAALRYRFGTRTTDFILCSRCGIYVAAIVEIDARLYATLNLNAFDGPRIELPATPVSYDGETAEAKAARRRLRWTPAPIA